MSSGKSQNGTPRDDFAHVENHWFRNPRGHDQWRSQSKNLGGKKFGDAKVFDFRRITLFCLEKRLSKHAITIVSKIWGDMAPFAPLATPMVTTLPGASRSFKIRPCWYARQPTFVVFANVRGLLRVVATSDCNNGPTSKF